MTTNEQKKPGMAPDTAGKEPLLKAEPAAPEAPAQGVYSGKSPTPVMPPPEPAEWPPQSAAVAERFGQPHAQLFPFIDKRVWTPIGVGRLFTAFAEDCEVVLDGTDKVTRVRTEDVRPLAGVEVSKDWPTKTAPMPAEWRPVIPSQTDCGCEGPVCPRCWLCPNHCHCLPREVRDE